MTWGSHGLAWCANLSPWFLFIFLFTFLNFFGRHPYFGRLFIYCAHQRKLSGRPQQLFLFFFLNLFFLKNLFLIEIKIFQFTIRRLIDFYSLPGNPPQCKAWAGQCLLYLCAVIVEKATITLLVQLDFWAEVQKFILLPVKNHPKVELFIVMLVIPFVFNVSAVFNFFLLLFFVSVILFWEHILKEGHSFWLSMLLTLSPLRGSPPMSKIVWR